MLHIQALELFQQRYENGYDLYTDSDYVAWLVANHPTDVPDDILGEYRNEQDHVRSDPFQPFEQDHVLSEPLEVRDIVSSNQSDNPAAKSSSPITEESSLRVKRSHSHVIEKSQGQVQALCQRSQPQHVHQI